MNLFSRRPHSQPTSDTQPDTSRDADLAADSIERARALARAGHLHEASRAYSRVPLKNTTIEIWLEHADLLLAMGDDFGAASNATCVLDLEPRNLRALAIRRKVLVFDDAPRKEGSPS